jgi:hypothetical protein
MSEKTPHIFNLPEELDMGNLPFKMAIDDASGQVALLLPKRGRWIFSDPSDKRVHKSIYKMFKTLSDRIGEASDLSGEAPQEVLVSFLTEMKLRKDQYEDSKKR